MATQKAITANPFRHNGATVLGGGNIDGVNVTNDLTLATNAFVRKSKVVRAVSPDESGNLGTLRPLSGGTFAGQVAGSYIMRRVTTTLAGSVANTVLKSGASDYGNRPYANAGIQEILDITSVDMYTGVATFGGNRGSGVPYIKPDDGSEVNFEAFPTDAVPGSLAYMVTGILPTQADYPPKTHSG